jgi:mitochondrial fission protein ELM1
MAEKTILLLSDGRPGHFRQSEAIVLALGRRIAIKVERIELIKPRIFPRRLARYAARWLPPGLVLRWLYGLRDGATPKPDAIVSAGGNTLAANIALAKKHRVPNIFSGTPRHIGPGEFALVLTPYKSEAALPNTAYALKPCALDPDAFPAPKRWPATPFRIAVFVGGPTPASDFREPDWQALGQLMLAMSTQQGVRFILVTSRRTPAEFYDALGPQLDRADIVERFVDHRNAGTGSIAEGYAADAIMVTSDSMSMITEGCAARRPVIVLAPAVTKPFRDNEAVESLAADNRLAVLPVREATPEQIAAKLEALTPMTENHLDRLGEIVAAAIAR